MRIALCDDNEYEREQLRAVLEELSDEWILEWDSFSSGEELIDRINTDKNIAYDLFILDIEMQGIDGISLAHDLCVQNRKALFIFVTNYSKYAIQAFDIHVVAYITKPITKERLNAELMKIKPYIKEFSKNFLFKSEYMDRKVNCRDILYFEKYGRELLIQTDKGRYRCNMSFKDMWKQITDTEFTFSHKSYVVNLSRIEMIKDNDVILDNGESIPISRKYKESLRLKHLYFLEGVL